MDTVHKLESVHILIGNPHSAQLAIYALVVTRMLLEIFPD